MKKNLFIIFVFASINIWGQTLYYERLGDGVSNLPPRCAYYDSTFKKLYIGGQFTQVENKTSNGVAVWSNNKWDTLKGGIANPGTYPVAITKFNNKIYFGGPISKVNNKPYCCIATWDGSNWDTLPSKPNASPMQLLVYNNQLYTVGKFSKCGDSTCYFVARFDGTYWHPIGNLMKYFKAYYPAQINCIAFYKNELYLGGSFMDSTGMDRNIVKFDGTNWVNVGTGIRQGFAWVNNMQEYKGELYIGGYFSKTPEIPSRGVVKWDGLQYKPFGYTGLQSGCQTSDMKVFKNQLFVVGNFTVVDNIQAGNIAVTDSTTICGLRPFDEPAFSPGFGGIQKIEPMGDTLVLIGAFDYLDTVKANYIGKMWGNFSNYSTCISIGIKELSTNSHFYVYPNPVSNILHIESKQVFEAGAEIEIINTLGQIVSKQRFNNEIDLTELSSGYYTLKVIIPNASPLITKFIKE